MVYYYPIRKVEMTYNNKEKQKEANRERQRRYRDKQKGVTLEGVMEQGVMDIKRYPAIITALVDPIKREKLERITAELKSRRLLKSVRYGVFGPTFEQVAEMLVITAA